MTLIEQPILQGLKDRLHAAYGDRLMRTVLFGSRARGDGRADSDYDVAVFLKGPSSFALDAGVLADIETYILFDTGAVINALPFPVGADLQARPLMGELRREGRDF